MPQRTDIHKIMIVGAGPIVIGQACEFDYSGTQACRALKELGYEIVLVNSNPATIMTDPEFSDHTYIEPITPEVVEKIIAKERPDALLPTMGAVITNVPSSCRMKSVSVSGGFCSAFCSSCAELGTDAVSNGWLRTAVSTGPGTCAKTTRSASMK